VGRPADVSSGGLKIEIKGRADPHPGTGVALVHEGYVSLTPLMSIVRASEPPAPRRRSPTHLAG
jgi:hypothetical protein